MYVHILPNLVAGNQTLQLHIQDVPVWISDGAVEAALAQYGTVQNPIRHGKVKVRENVYIASGVRFATFRPATPRKPIPSFVKSRDGLSTFRVHHEGQAATCRLCGTPGHIAKICPKTTKQSQNTQLQENHQHHQQHQQQQQQQQQQQLSRKR